MKVTKSLYAVVMAGGSGTRFWPLSRENSPKQMLRIVGDETMISQTIRRCEGFIPSGHIYIVTNVNQAMDIRMHLRGPGEKGKGFHIIAEPCGRNTAPAIGLAAAYLKQVNPDSIMVVLPSDHNIGNERAFLKIIREAIKGAEKGYLVTLGIKPARPDVGYGYIKVNSKLKTQNSKDIYTVERFVEKPDIKTAQGYVKDGRYYWNSGIFVWKASMILREIDKYLPSLSRGLKRIEKALKKGDGEGVLRDVYSHLEGVSIDYGVLEKSKRVLVIPADIGWSDVGSWAALDEVLNKDSRGNILKGNVIDLDSKDTIVFAGDRLVATVGLQDMVVVDTPDATLVCPKEKSQDVKRVVEELKRGGREEHILHRTVERPWGSYTVLEKGDRYKIKRLFIKSGGRLSLQVHRHRSEHWVVVSGTARITRGDKIFLLHPNESTYIPMSTRHRLENPGLIPLQVIEVQNGEYLEEDDIERVEDEYGR